MEYMTVVSWRRAPCGKMKIAHLLVWALGKYPPNGETGVVERMREDAGGCGEGVEDAAICRYSICSACVRRPCTRAKYCQNTNVRLTSIGGLMSMSVS